MSRTATPLPQLKVGLLVANGVRSAADWARAARAAQGHDGRVRVVQQAVLEELGRAVGGSAVRSIRQSADRRPRAALRRLAGQHVHRAAGARVVLVRGHVAEALVVGREGTRAS